MQLTQFTKPIKESVTLAINQQAKQLKQAGENVCHLGFGESPFPVHKKIQQSLIENSDKKSYLPGLGLPNLRQNIAKFQQKYFGYDLHSEHIAIGPGSKELIFQALHLLQGDVIIPTPTWVSYYPQASILNKRVIFLARHAENHYQLDPENLKKAAIVAKSKQKILILNSPNNPTAQIYPPSNLKALAKTCREHNITVISDEIYALVNFTNTYASLFQYCPERVIITSGMSKAFSAGGYRMGFLATTNKAFMQQLSIVISETFSCVASPVQYAAMTAFSDDLEIMQYVHDCNQIQAFASNYACDRFLDMGLDCLPAQGTFYLYPKFSAYQQKLLERGIKNSKDLCLSLLQQTGLVLLPGENFGSQAHELAVRVAVVDYEGATAYQIYREQKQQNKAIDLLTVMPNLKNGLDRLQSWLN